MFKRNNKKSRTQTIELDINSALNIEKHLNNISEGDNIIVSKKDEQLFHTAAQLIQTLTSIYGMWNTSKKK